MERIKKGWMGGKRTDGWMSVTYDCMVGQDVWIDCENKKGTDGWVENGQTDG